MIWAVARSQACISSQKRAIPPLVHKCSKKCPPPRGNPECRFPLPTSWISGKKNPLSLGGRYSMSLSQNLFFIVITVGTVQYLLQYGAVCFSDASAYGATAYFWPALTEFDLIFEELMYGVRDVLAYLRYGVMQLFQDEIIWGHSNFWFRKKCLPVPYCHKYCMVP